jgi:uncharacterized protein YwgA
MDDKKKFPKGWEILLACYLLNGRVYGRVRLQKVVSEMQKEGFPVDYSFVILDMGPFSSSVQDNVRQLKNSGLIEVYQMPMPEGYNDRFDYVLTEKGKRVVEDEILPVFEKKYDYFKENLRKIPAKYNNSIPSREIVDLVHKELILDDMDEFKNELENTLRRYHELLKKLSEEDQRYCLVWVAVLGLADLVVEILEKIKEDVEMSKDPIIDLLLPDEAGKYFILSKAKEGLGLITTHYPFEECRNEVMCISEKWNECKKFEQKIKAVFMAIERNALLYSYLDESEEGEEFLEVHSV